MLVLASASPRRSELLRELGVPFRVAPIEVDETPPAGAPPAVAARVVAARKALAAIASPSEPVLGADTIVVAADGRTVLGKPADRADALRMLRCLAGTTHSVITGVCVLPVPRREPICAHDVTWVTMRPVEDREIEDYVDSGESYGKAGGYAIQETGDRFVTRVDGSWSNVVGLPLELVRRLLAEAGVPVPTP